jgi:thiamine-monophosphate kinase
MARRRRISNEFELIERHFAPLAVEPGAFGLTDDAAVLTPPTGHQIVVTSDCLVADVHFRTVDDPMDIAAKLLRVNLSDLAAMGANPHAYTMAAALPDTIDEDWIGRFAAGLAADQARFAVALVGGDTVSTPGALTLTVTAFGFVPDGEALLRSTARAGDDIYVSGTLGDAALGLRYLKDDLASLDATTGAALADRYFKPRPRLELGSRLAPLATAAIDVSDGLVADLGHICHASRLDATITASAVPLSPEAGAAISLHSGLATIPLTGGDDYELVFCAPPDAAQAIADLAREIAVPVTIIGTMRSGTGQVDVVDGAGRPVTLDTTGYRHF